jgi:hypothetical protein
LREAVNTRDAWARIAGLQEDDEADDEAARANNEADVEPLRKTG